MAKEVLTVALGILLATFVLWALNRAGLIRQAAA